MTLKEASIRTGLSERWIREYVYREWLYPAKVPYPGGFRYDFSEADIKRAKEIHVYLDQLWGLRWKKRPDL